MPFTVGQYLTANDLKSQEDAHTLGYGVVNGLKVVPDAPPSMDIDVEVGKCYAADTVVVKGAVTTLTVTAADPANPRKDIVVCNSAGTLSIVAGTPEAALPGANVGVYTLEPEPPSIPANSIILAEIWVPAGAAAITGGEIYDKRVSIADFLTHKDATTGVHGVGASPVCSEAELAARVPSGLIVLWHGTIANIPPGWVLCDGGSSTPNLLARFIEGVATAATNPGATGGATGKTTSSHYHSGPSHYHSGPSHTHTTPAQNTAGHYHTQPSHTHSLTRVSLKVGQASTAPYYCPANTNSGGSQNTGSKTDSISAGNTGAGGTGNTGAGGTGNTGSKTASISDIRPKYYDIAFLMKT